MLRKEGSVWVLRSKKTGRVLGRGTKTQMIKREKQVRGFASRDKTKTKGSK